MTFSLVAIKMSMPCYLSHKQSNNHESRLNLFKVINLMNCTCRSCGRFEHMTLCTKPSALSELHHVSKLLKRMSTMDAKEIFTPYKSREHIYKSNV